ncbi:hypothetical protein F5Y09DRAFT_337289 [Xylaria sp. FL1042]|nr:hypothetical protein F5Y09DRAFT_337289 [Xylaria sp. FL1042]
MERDIWCPLATSPGGPGQLQTFRSPVLPRPRRLQSGPKRYAQPYNEPGDKKATTSWPWSREPLPPPPEPPLHLLTSGQNHVRDLFQDRSTSDECARASSCHIPGSPGSPRNSTPKRPCRSPWRSLQKASGPPSHYHLPMTHRAAQRTPTSSMNSSWLVVDYFHPTGITIKNIPLDCKQETLQRLMADMNLPEPINLEYSRFRNGAFMGVAFANYRTPKDRAVVVHEMQDLQFMGHKLAVRRNLVGPRYEIARKQREIHQAVDQLRKQHESRLEWSRVPEKYQVAVATHLRPTPKHPPRSDWRVSTSRAADFASISRRGLLELLSREEAQKTVTVWRLHQILPKKKAKKLTKAALTFWRDDNAAIVKLTPPDIDAEDKNAPHRIAIRSEYNIGVFLDFTLKR